MEARRDALAAAAEVVLAIEDAARAEPPETVATVGVLTVSPGAVSVIPGETRLAIDVRGISSESLDRLDGAIRARVAEIGERRGLAHDLVLTRAGEPVALDAGLARAAREAAARLQVPARETWSGAGHDAQHLNALIPCLLTFVPLHGGESHTPQEGAAMDEILQAGRLIAAVLGPVALDTNSEV
jgi:beta-ureidopropionase / N-carbamoyl-L-amino-acid hydrolase